ncbi:MAG: hypothetical protein J2P45_02085 [Candidatus Dormibacteraeota bacterium]|nr:hypothetical protein [Candidatus Dormibacteraeota bacterium]
MRKAPTPTLMTACELTQRHCRPLVAPMAQALPWLLGRPPDQPPVA